MGADKTSRPHDRLGLLLAAHITEDTSMLNIVKILPFSLNKVEDNHFLLFWKI